MIDPIPEDLMREAIEQVRQESDKYISEHPEIVDEIRREYAAFSAMHMRQNRPVPESEEAFVRRKSVNYAMMAKIKYKLQPVDPAVVKEHFGGALPKGWDDLLPECH